ncbi:seryl-tRNA synthetase [Naegleria gruberi]|uniref:serine--tRNA ligase n=1 Tax=Naegleria gruberi TaxID=5762 RepID=D2UX41_NAEGR|nr:seryl-tRNA synthetase [Naegleria gruberi]EFC50867.1 seryl-tRNA synthetase [Naegleria gruberi]|eukprot:XP_002683611.1 seryl-tRNA synthetase [Naegleria gruberi strain NEG-M]
MTSNNNTARTFHTNNVAASQQQEHKAKNLPYNYNFEKMIEKQDEMKENIKLRELNIDLDQVLKNYEQYIQIDQEYEQVQYLRKEIAEYLAGKRTSEQVPIEIKNLIKEDLENKKADSWKVIGKEFKTKIQNLEKIKNEVYQELCEKTVKLPNFTEEGVMKFSKENSNQPNLVKYVGEKKETIPKLSHYEICEKLDLFEPANECSGSKFFFLKNEGVLLEVALQNFAISKLLKRGFKIIMPPELMKQSIVEGCGFQPRGEHSQIYRIENSNQEPTTTKNGETCNDSLCLIGTSEIGLAALHCNEFMPNFKGPLKYAGLSHCFRTEAGAAGSKDRGLYRVHQFTKVEMFVYCEPEQSEALLDEIVSIQEEIFSELGFHFQILDMPCNDLGNPAFRKIDMEAFIPSRLGYGEVSSASNCTDYQSRKLNIRYRSNNTTVYPHTLNGTAMAVPRAIITILENNQFYDENGKLGVKIPKPLVPFMLSGQDVIMEK